MISGASQRRLLFILVSILICMAISGVSADQHAPVVVVVANDLSLDDLISAGPNVRGLITHGAVGLVNTGLQHKTELDIRYLAMGAGIRSDAAGDAVTLGDAVTFCDAAEMVGTRNAGEMYASQTGRTARAGSVVCLGFTRLLRANEQPAFRVESIGMVGDAFHKAGLRTAVIGNSDTPDQLIRRAPLLAMDRYGMVDSGVVGASTLKVDPHSPCGVSDNLEAMSALTHKFLADHALVVIELGDLNRLESMQPALSDAAYQKYRALGIRSLDTLVGRMLPDIERRRATLLICTPCRTQSKGYWSNLSPALMYKPGGQAGLLISATARTRGLISNIDIGPTIIHAAGLDVPEFVTGRPAMATPSDYAVEHLQRLERIASRNYAIQIPVLVCVGILVVISATLSEIVLRKSRRAWHRKALGAAFLVIMSIPGTLLLVDGLEGQGIAAYLLNLTLGVLAILVVAWLVSGLLTWIRRGRQIPLPAVIFGSTALLVVVDVLTGARLLRWSISSCDQITGIRYYGLGNEYMGLLIGAALLGPVLFLRSSCHGSAKNQNTLSRPATIAPVTIWFLFTAFVIGFPRLGANVGGLLTAVPAFGIAVVSLLGIRVRARHVLALLALGFITVAVFATVDVLSPGIGGSHLGRSIALARIYGWDWLVYLIGGKILMHIGILKLPQTYYPLLCSIPFFLMYGGRMKAEMASVRETDVLYRIGFPAVLAGMVTALLFNDSGIVPAVFIMAMFILTVQYLRLTEERS